MFSLSANEALLTRDETKRTSFAGWKKIPASQLDPGYKR